VRIATGSDHRGFRLKQTLMQHLASAGHVVVDFGCYDESAVDFTDIAIPLSRAVASGEEDLGLLICSNGVGMTVCANKIRGIRAALCHDPFAARRARQHTNANVLCLGAWCVGEGVARDIVDAFLASEFEGGRHARRLEKLQALETGWNSPVDV
jgi:ribose 5-phosphate isomerase B